MAGRATKWLDEHPQLRTAMARSAVWPRVKREAAVTIRGQPMYVVAGDTLGGEEELFLDRLARGAREAGADALSRELFQEQSQAVQAIVLTQLLQ
ncbi:MAG: hypothetical protein ABI818_07275 [Acidobacteriota bacterium]